MKKGKKTGTKKTKPTAQADQSKKVSQTLSEFSKKDTLVVKGMAIIFLILYHCFSAKDRLCGYDVSFGLMDEYTAMYIFESMNICVGIFAFLSSYGLTKTMMLKYKTLDLDRHNVSDFVTRRTVSLIGSFLIPYILCAVPTFIFTDYNTYGDVDFVFNMIADILGIAGLLGSRMLVGTWWYMSFALIIIFLLPFTVRLYRRFGVLCVVPFILVPFLLNTSFFSAKALDNMTRWLLTIPMGVIFADLKVFERMRAAHLTNNKVVSKIIKFVILTAVLVLLVMFRKMPWCIQHLHYFISSILPVYFIYWMYEFVCVVPLLNSVLAFLGKHSSNIFFMHTFIRFVWFKDVTYGLGTWSLIFLFVFVCSLILSFAVTGVQRLTRWNKLVKWTADKLSGINEKIITVAVSHS